MDDRSKEKIGYMFLTALAFGVGVLVGGQGCQPGGEPGAERTRAGGVAVRRADGCPACAPKVVEQVVEKIVKVPGEVIYRCPPKPEAPAKKRKGRAAVKRKLPEPEPAVDPLARRRLLAWVRERSDDLKVCRDDSKKTYRVAVIMHIHPETERLTRVDVNANRGLVPGAVSACIRQRILRWKPPVALVRGQRRVMFGLNL